MADQLFPIPGRVLDANADPGAGYLVTFYASGTTTPKTVYSDAALTTPLSQPVATDSEGNLQQVFVSGGATKAIITDADGATVATIDPVLRVSASSSAASNVTFDATVDLPYTNVQDAIEGAAASAATGFNAYGLGVTGSGVLLANVDATNIGSGQYRFDNTTAGTFPNGVSAANTGTVVMIRETATSGHMILGPDTTTRMWFRRLTAGSWSGWLEYVNATDTTAEGALPYRGASNWAGLAIGTAGQVLTVNSGATAPEWATPNAGRVLLATKTASASASLDFTEFDNATYRRYEFELDAVLPATDAVSLYLRTSTDGGSTYDSGASDYQWNANGFSGAAATQGGAATASDMQLNTVIVWGNSTNETGVSGLLRLWAAPAATYTHVEGAVAGWSSAGTLLRLSVGGARLSAADVDACQFLFSSGNITSGTIRMYGIV